MCRKTEKGNKARMKIRMSINKGNFEFNGIRQKKKKRAPVEKTRINRKINKEKRRTKEN